MKVYNVMIIHCWFLNVGRLGWELSENSFNSVLFQVKILTCTVINAVKTNTNPCLQITYT